MKKMQGNVLNVQEGIIVHGCNTLGKMGAGIALQIKKKYPEAFRAYKQRESETGLILGEVCFAQVGARLWIANVMTQNRIYGARGECLVDLGAIERGMVLVGDKARKLKLPVHMPEMGCGLAGGTWMDVEPRVLSGLGEDVDACLWLYKPEPEPSRSWRH